MSQVHIGGAGVDLAAPAVERALAQLRARLARDASDPEWLDRHLRSIEDPCLGRRVWAHPLLMHFYQAERDLRQQPANIAHSQDAAWIYRLGLRLHELS
jgi:hypothetical protein